MVGLADIVLNFEELLGIDVRPGVFLTINNAGLKGRIGFENAIFCGTASTASNWAAITSDD